MPLANSGACHPLTFAGTVTVPMVAMIPLLAWSMPAT
jgi:hypothetical protein